MLKPARRTRGDVLSQVADTSQVMDNKGAGETLLQSNTAAVHPRTRSHKQGTGRVAMNLAEDLVALPDVDLSTLSAEIHRTGRPKLITKNGVGDLVVLAVEDYQELQETLEVAAGLLRGDADAGTGRVRSNAEAQALLRARIAAAAQPASEPS